MFKMKDYEMIAKVTKYMISLCDKELSIEDDRFTWCTHIQTVVEQGMRL